MAGAKFCLLEAKATVLALEYLVQHLLLVKLHRVFKEQIYREDTSFFMQFLHMETQFNPLLPPKESRAISVIPEPTLKLKSKLLLLFVFLEKAFQMPVCKNRIKSCQQAVKAP